MPHIYAIKARIKSVESTRQVTKSMKMVSTAKLRRTQYTMNRVRPFAEHCRRILECLCTGELDTKQELMQAIHRLPTDFREVILLHYYQGYGIAEIAAMPEFRAITFSAPVRAFTLSSRQVTVGLITRE